MAVCENNMHGKNPSPAAEENYQKNKPHVLVVPWPAQGHINPMMHLSTHLAANGVIITFVNTQFNHDRIIHSQASRADTQNPDSESIDLHVEGDIRLVGVPDGLGHEEYVVNFNIYRQAQALIDMEPLLVKLVEKLEPPITCIIADLFVISTPAVARRFDIPHVMLWTQSAACYATHVYFTENHAFLKDQIERLRNEESRVIGKVPGCPELSYKEVPTFLQPCDPSDFLFSNMMTSFERARANAYVLMNTLEELEAESLSFIDRPNMLCIGPLLPPQFLTPSLSTRPLINNKLDPSFWRVDHEGCMPWLHQQSPSSVLYVSFGSITIMPAQQASEFAAGLEASGCPFLMVVRPEMLIGGASATLPEGFVDRMRASGRAAFVQWAPQLEVLAHPAIGGFLTHAGWNSTLESLCLGVPMLCWPYFGDQMLNTRCIVDTWKIGFTLAMNNVMGTEKFTRNGVGASDISDSSSSNVNDSDGNTVALVTSEEIERKVRQLMDPFTSKDIRKRVHILSLAAKKKASEGSSFRTLLDFLFG